MEAKISHKGGRIKSYDLQFKSDVIRYAETNGNHAAAPNFKVDVKRIREWRSTKESIISTCATKGGNKQKERDGCSKKVINESFEEHLLCWIHERRAKSARVSCILIMKKTKLIFNEAYPNEPDKFQASRGWLEKYM